MARFVDVVLIICQLYFMLMNVTVERCYCHGPLTAGDTRFLMPETLDFAQQHNPLFLSRPRWMQMATCISAYGFLPFYFIILLAALLDRWATFKIPVLLFIGAKCCAPTPYSNHQHQPMRDRNGSLPWHLQMRSVSTT